MQNRKNRRVDPQSFIEVIFCVHFRKYVSGSKLDVSENVFKIVSKRDKVQVNVQITFRRRFRDNFHWPIVFDYFQGLFTKQSD